MEEHDDWKLGDDAEPVACPRCGKPNRAGLSYCTICGSPLIQDELGADPETFRTLGEAMAGGRPRRGRSGPSLRALVLAASALLAVVVLLMWLQTREEPFLVEDWMAPPVPTPSAAPPPASTASAVPTAVATRVAAPTAQPLPTATVVAPERTAIATALPTPRRTATTGRRAVAPPTRVPTRRPPPRREPPPPPPPPVR